MITFQPKTVDIFLEIGSDFKQPFLVPQADTYDFYGIITKNYQGSVTLQFTCTPSLDNGSVIISLSSDQTLLLKPDQYEYELRKKNKVTNEVSRVAIGNLIATGNQYAWGSM